MKRKQEIISKIFANYNSVYHCISLSLVLLFVGLTANAMTDSNNVSEFSRKLAVFSINLYSKLTLLKPNENIIFSPFSIQTCNAMVRLGAEGQTAEELDHGLGLVSSNVDEIAAQYHKILSVYEHSNILHIANKIYIMHGYNVRDEFNELLSKQFLSSVDSIDFAANVQAASSINNWVASKTNNLIQNLVSPTSLNQDTRLVLVNAIHFKGDWVHKFPKRGTHNEDFYLSESDTIKVPLMNLREDFNYADLKDLDAQALEMRYKDSDLSMLVILPNSRTGLKTLENKLKTVPLTEITNQLRMEHVGVKFPKFKAEFSMELSEPLKQLGIQRMFGDSAEFGKILKSPEAIKVSKVVHKAVIDVNEEGTEAAAATGMTICLASMPMFRPQPREFHVNRPFTYTILNKIGQQLLFVGNIHKP